MGIQLMEKVSIANMESSGMYVVSDN